MSKKIVLLALCIFGNTIVKPIEIATVAAALTLSKVTWDCGCGIYRHFWPSQNELNRAIVSSHEAEIFKAEQNLSDCLISSPEALKDEDGFPCVCKKQKDDYRRAAGLIKYEQMRRAFRKFNQDLPK